MNNNNNLSIVLATYNEEKNIAKCLNSIKSVADEIIVVDGSSEDKTREIARSLGAKVTKVKNIPMFHTNKQKAIDLAKGNWILQLDADEIVSEELLEEVKKTISVSTKYNAFFIPRKNFFLGRWLKKGGQYPDKVIRFFKRGKAHLPQKSVHEQMIVKDGVGNMKGHLIHYTAPTFSRYMTNANRYTSLTATELERKGTRINVISVVNYLLLKPTITFFKIYIRHKGVMDGFEGFVFALFSGLHWSIAFLKLWEKKYTKNTNKS